MYFAGGRTDREVSDIVDIYNLVNLTIVTKVYLAVPRYGLASVTIGKTMFFAGGYNTTATGIVDVWVPGTGTYYTTTLQETKYGLVGITFNGMAIFAGGHNGRGSCSDTLDIYRAKTDSGSTTTTTSTTSTTTTIGNNAPPGS